MSGRRGGGVGCEVKPVGTKLGTMVCPSSAQSQDLWQGFGPLPALISLKSVAESEEDWDNLRHIQDDIYEE